MNWHNLAKKKSHLAKKNLQGCLACRLPNAKKSLFIKSCHHCIISDSFIKTQDHRGQILLRDRGMPILPSMPKSTHLGTKKWIAQRDFTTLLIYVHSTNLHIVHRKSADFPDQFLTMFSCNWNDNSIYIYLHFGSRKFSTYFKNNNDYDGHYNIT